MDTGRLFGPGHDDRVQETIQQFLIRVLSAEMRCYVRFMRGMVAKRQTFVRRTEGDEN